MVFVCILIQNEMECASCESDDNEGDNEHAGEGSLVDVEDLGQMINSLKKAKVMLYSDESS